MGNRPSSTEKLAAIAVGILAVVSPLYIDRKASDEPEDDEGSGGLSLLLPFALILLIVAVSLTCLVDRRFMRFDPYWIHRVGGSSCGIITLLLVLGVVLKCKASLGN